MSLVFPIDRAYRISPVDNGNMGEFGPAAAGLVGTWAFDFVPDLTFDGSVVVMGRGAGPGPSEASVPHVPFPYRAIYVNGAYPPVPYGLQYDALTGRSTIQVPCSGFSIAVLINCIAGFGWLYTRDLEGPSVP